MAKSIRVYTKINRAQSPGAMVGVRLQAEDLELLDRWIAAEDDDLSRPEAVRRLMAKGLK